MKTPRLNALATFIFALAPVLLSNAQTQARQSAAPRPKVAVSLPRTSYRIGEVIEATATLENAGPGSFYVPNWWSESAGGIPGFDVELRHGGQPFCHVSGDFACASAEQKKNMHKSTDQLLRERFILLQPGSLIGMRIHLATACALLPHPVLAPGDYEVIVVYTGHDVCLPDLSQRQAKFPILQSTVEGDPIHVQLTE